MLYATSNDLEIIVAAATTIAEFDEFCGKIESEIEGARRPDFFEAMSDEYLSKFKVPPVIIPFSDHEARDKFWSDYGLVDSRRTALIDRHDDMIVAHKEERDFSNTPDGTTIGEYYGIDKDDPWDKRTDEEKAKDEEMQKLFEKAKKAGNLSGESFGMPTGNKTARVSDIRTSVDQDGKVEVDSVMAIKGLYDDNDKDRIEAEAKARGDSVENTKEEEELIEINDDLAIDPNGIIAIYHKVEVLAKTVADVKSAMAAQGLDLDNYANHTRTTSTGCWTASARLDHAKAIEDILVKAGMRVELYGVNDIGERLAPKGVEVVDTDAKKDLPPRRWNERADEIKTMDEEALKANRKSIKPDEFLFCGAYEGAELGSIVYIVPTEWFKKNKCFFPESLDIGHILPADMKEKSTGVYQSLSRDWTSMSIELGHRGFMESGLLQLYMNNL